MPFETTSVCKNPTSKHAQPSPHNPVHGARHQAAMTGFYLRVRAARPTQPATMLQLPMRWPLAPSRRPYPAVRTFWPRRMITHLPLLLLHAQPSVRPASYAPHFLGAWRTGRHPERARCRSPRAAAVSLPAALHGEWLRHPHPPGGAHCGLPPAQVRGAALQSPRPARASATPWRQMLCPASARQTHGAGNCSCAPLCQGQRALTCATPCASRAFFAPAFAAQATASAA